MTLADPKTKEKVELKAPKLYKVLLYNDDYTSMDFVVAVIEKVFYKTEEEATQIMLSVHEKGRGICGEYTAELAETKVHIVHEFAQNAGYPLLCTMEEV